MPVSDASRTPHSPAKRLNRAVTTAHPIDAAQIGSVSDLFTQKVEAATVRRILLVAVDHFARDGFHATSTREIAKNAGLSPAAVYVHFRAKEDVLYMIVSIITEWMFERMVAANDAGGEPRDRMARLVRTYVECYAIMRGPMHLTQYEFSALNPRQRKAILSRRDSMEEFFRDCLQAGRDAGTFGAADASVTKVAIVSLCISVLNWFSPKGELTPTQLGERYAELVLKMLAPGGASSTVNRSRITRVAATRRA